MSVAALYGLFAMGILPGHAQIIMDGMLPGQQIVFETPLSAIAAPTASAPIRNVGQSMHFIQITAPTGNSGEGCQIRLEWSRDGVNWRPAGPDITKVPVLDGGIPGIQDVVAYGAYYGAFRAIRVNSLGFPNKPLTIQYTGNTIPTVPFVTLTDDRWIFQPNADGPN